MEFGASVANGLSAAFAMAQGRPDWEERMDMSPAAVFRSFWALPLALLPLALAVAAGRQMALANGQSPAGFVPVFLEAALVAMAIWVLIVGFYMQVARRIGAGWRISPLLIANNYATLFGYTALGVGSGLSAILGSPEIFGLVWPMVMVVGLWLDWGMLRRALEMNVEMTLVTIIFVQFAALLIAQIIGEVVSAVLRVLFGLG